MDTKPDDHAARSLVIHEQLRGKIGIFNKLPVKTRDDLSIAYTPGVARPCEVIAEDKSAAQRLTIKGNAVGVAPPQGQIIHSAYISRFSEAIRWGCTS